MKGHFHTINLSLYNASNCWGTALPIRQPFFDNVQSGHMNDNIKLSERLRIFRKKVNITQLEMSKYLNLGSTTYKSYEQEISEPSIETLIKLADFYHVSLDELVGRETDIVNLKSIDEDQSLIIKAVLRMNKEQLSYTKRFVTSMMSDEI